MIQWLEVWWEENGMGMAVIYRHEVVEYYTNKEIILGWWIIQKRSIHATRNY